MRATRTQVYAALDSERDYQDGKIIGVYGSLPGPVKTLESYAVYIDDYTRQLKSQLSRIWGPACYIDALDTLRKITALGVAAMEAHGAPPRIVLRADGALKSFDERFPGHM